VTLREDGQGLEDQLLGTSAHVDGYDFAVLDNMMIFDAEDVTTPVGEISTEWMSTLTKEWADGVEADGFNHGQAN
jgi:branched-chain amino acid transport system substrate-binding protein